MQATNNWSSVEWRQRVNVDKTKIHITIESELNQYKNLIEREYIKINIIYHENELAQGFLGRIDKNNKLIIHGTISLHYTKRKENTSHSKVYSGDIEEAIKYQRVVAVTDVLIEGNILTIHQILYTSDDSEEIECRIQSKQQEDRIMLGGKGLRLLN